jgi:uncharacterized membrane protein YqaE (UPF0057 family)
LFHHKMNFLSMSLITLIIPPVALVLVVG